MTRQCSTCRHWQGKVDPLTGQWEVRAECRATPPLPTLGWPVTMPIEFCGWWDAPRPTAEEMTGK